MKRFFRWHEKMVDWFQDKLGISDYAMLWISFLKGVLLVILILILI